MTENKSAPSINSILSTVSNSNGCQKVSTDKVNIKMKNHLVTGKGKTNEIHNQKKKENEEKKPSKAESEGKLVKKNQWKKFENHRLTNGMNKITQQQNSCQAQIQNEMKESIEEYRLRLKKEIEESIVMEIWPKGN